MRSILASGWLKKRSHNNRNIFQKYYVRRLHSRHLPMVMVLQKVIYRHLHDSDLLQTFSQDFMQQHMGKQGEVLGVFVADRIVAFRNLYYPSPWDMEWNLGVDLNLPASDLAGVVNLQMVCVHPSYRGNNLALIMNQIALNMLRRKDTHPNVCATVSPYNIWNLPVLLKSGFSMVKLKQKYGKKIRYIVHQNLRNPRRFHNNGSLRVNLENLDTQRELLNRGYCGVELKPQQCCGRAHSVSGFNLTFKLPIHNGQQPKSWPVPPMWTFSQQSAHGRGVAI